MTSPRRVARGAFTEEEKRIATIVDGLKARNLWSYIERVADAHHVLIDEILGRSRQKGTVAARHALWVALHDECGLSWPQVAALFGKSHDSIVHAGGAKERRTRTLMETRVSSAIADFVTAQGRPDLGKRIRAGEWRTAAKQG